MIDQPHAEITEQQAVLFEQEISRILGLPLEGTIMRQINPEGAMTRSFIVGQYVLSVSRSEPDNYPSESHVLVLPPAQYEANATIETAYQYAVVRSAGRMQAAYAEITDVQPNPNKTDHWSDSDESNQATIEKKREAVASSIRLQEALGLRVFTRERLADVLLLLAECSLSTEINT